MQKSCDVCGASYEARRPNSRYCSGQCRARASRAGQARRKGSGSEPEKPDFRVEADQLVESTRARLKSVDRLDTLEGQQAIFLARQFGNPMNSAAGLASLNRELRTTMADALRGTRLEADPVDELQARRNAKLAGLGSG